jgi:polyisoprenoid-binding protein YceI
MNIFATVAAAAFVASAAHADHFEIRGGKDASLVRFVSKAAMESFEGKTHAVTGSVSLNAADLGDTLSILVRVDMATLDTGIALRNQHMRANHLHTDQFPAATFAGARIVEGSGALEAGVTRRVVLAGTLTIHGVARAATVPIDLTWDGSDRLTVGAKFPVALADHDIPRPKFLMLKLGETQNVVVALVAERATLDPGASQEPASPDSSAPD